MEECKKLAQFISSVHYDKIPEMVINKAKELILDQLGCQLAGATLPWSKATYKYVRDNEVPREESTVVYYNFKTIAQDAAFANANFGHGLMVDDTDSICHAHLGSIIIPAALAMGEREMINGKDFIKAVVTGYDVASRIGAAAPSIQRRGFHIGPVIGPFGAAACASIILGLNESQISDALSIAGSHSSGLMEYSISGGSVNRLHAGIAAYGGIRASLLAKEGFTGPKTILEGQKGFINAFSGESSPDEITRKLGQEYRILLTGLKPYCCCGTQIAGLDAVSKIISEHTVIPKEIKEIIVNASPAVFRLASVIKVPEDITSAQFSGRFGIALRLLKRSNGFKDYVEENLKDPEVLDLISKTKYILDDSLGKPPADGTATNVTIKMLDGTVFSETIHAPKGSMNNPMTKEEVWQKFTELASLALPDYKLKAIIETIAEIDHMADICELSRLMTAV